MGTSMIFLLFLKLFDIAKLTKTYKEKKVAISIFGAVAVILAAFVIILYTNMLGFLIFLAVLFRRAWLVMAFICSFPIALLGAYTTYELILCYLYRFSKKLIWLNALINLALFTVFDISYHVISSVLFSGGVGYDLNIFGEASDTFYKITGGGKDVLIRFGVTLALFAVFGVLKFFLNRLLYKRIFKNAAQPAPAELPAQPDQPEADLSAE